MKFIKLKAFFKDFYRKMNGCELCGNENYHVEICTEGGIRLCNDCDPQPKTQHEVMIDLLNEQQKILEALDEKLKSNKVSGALQELKDAMDKWDDRQKVKRLSELEEKLDDLVYNWHNNSNRDIPLSEYLGVTEAEYASIVTLKLDHDYEAALEKVMHMNTFRLGLDLHGVVDTYPDKFVRLARLITRTGGDVIICTGSSDNEKLQTQLLSYNNGVQWWTSIFSITDYLKSRNIPHTESADGGIKVENILWDQAKGDWAREFNIDLHIDDSPEYGKYFDKGIYLKFNERKNDDFRTSYV